VNAEQAINELTARLAVAERRLARLDAKEAVLRTLNHYLYCLDVGYPDELVRRVFTTDAVLEVVNFPPGTMQDHVLTGHAEILPLYADHTRTAPAIQGGHHTSNVAVDVAADASSAELSAYFMTSGGTAGSLQGGQYQGEAVPDGDGWRFRRFRILSGWGWRVPRDSVRPITDSLPAERAWGGARPAGTDISPPATAADAAPA
jgi:SnoaL-like domain